MKNILRSIYSRMPIIKDIHAFRHAISDYTVAINAIQSERQKYAYFCRRADCTNIVHAIETIKASDPRYRDKRRLLAYGAQYWSQNYEDGMIAEIFRRIEATTQTFVEIGVENGSETNTTALLSQGWRGWWFEGNAVSCESIRTRLRSLPSLSSRLSLREEYVLPSNIQGLFEDEAVPKEVDLFSLDIDLDTYHIWAALAEFRPRVIVVEYNAGIPANQNWIHPYNPSQMWDGSQDFGASLKAYEILGKKRGYSLVGCDITGVNAFFVRDDLLDEKFLGPFTAENHYEPPRYGLLYRWGHSSCLFGETHQVSVQVNGACI